MVISKESIKQAYLFLKRNVYHENLNLFLKHRVAAFEISGFENSINSIYDVIASKEPLQHPLFKEWLTKIDYSLLPKSISRPEDEEQKQHNEIEGLFISNVSVSPVYEISKVNYLINAPIELHIIDVLWTLISGSYIEKSLSDDCYSNRLHESANRFVDNLNKTEKNTTYAIFKRYVDQYDSWRDKAINCATQLAKEDEDVALLSLDLKSYFYHIEIDFTKVQKCIDNSIDSPEINLLASSLTNLLQKIFSTYYDVIQSSIEVTHADCHNKSGLPIGFVSSSILSNWYLSAFDNDISDSVRPAYYGRYVDDILMVFKRPKIESKNPIKSFVKYYLKGLVTYVSTKSLYKITVEGNDLPIQHDKLILQYFDKNHSQAGLEVFKQELEERSSAFRFLPDDHMENELDKFAYDILYDGSANKLRSIVGLAENESELSKFLSSHITAHRLCRLDKDDVVLPQLKVFFRGANILRFSRLWEKVYQYAVILDKPRFVIQFYKSVKEEVSKISFFDGKNTTKTGRNITQKLKDDLELYNKLSLSICMGLLNVKPYLKPTTDELKKLDIDELLELILNNKLSSEGLTGLQYFSYHESLDSYIRYFRQSNLIRHNLVAWPLANFTDYLGDLTDDVLFRDSLTNELSEEKIHLSPRFIHFDEYQIFALNNALEKDLALDTWLSDTISEYEKNTDWDEFPVNLDKTDKTDEKIKVSKLKIGKRVTKNKLRIALANLRVDSKDIESSIRVDESPNVSFSRQSQLYRLLNDAVREQANILILPEVSIPVAWLPFMIAHARRHQIGIVFGLELWKKKKYVYNQ